MVIIHAKTPPTTCVYEARKDDPSNWHGNHPRDWQLEMDSWSCPHEVIDHPSINNPKYCVFHTDSRKIPADVDEATEFVRVVNEESNTDDQAEAKRKKEFIGAEFGSFEIKGRPAIDAKDNFPIRFDHAKFQNGLTASCVFCHGITAKGTQFNAPKTGTFAGISFNFAEFAGNNDVSFKNAEFTGDGRISFKKSTFTGNGDVLFGGTKFINKGTVSFHESRFTGSGCVKFSFAEFDAKGGVSFEGSIFSKEELVTFTGAKFRGGGKRSFFGTIFNNGNSVIFDHTDFRGSGDISFENAKFTNEGDVLFHSTKFTNDGDVSFRRADFSNSGNVRFARAILNQADFFETDLTNADLTNANFRGVDLIKVDLTDANLTDTDFTNADLRDTIIKPTICDGICLENVKMSNGTHIQLTTGNRFGFTAFWELRDPEPHERVAREAHALRKAAAANGLLSKARHLRVRERKERRREAGSRCLSKPLIHFSLEDFWTWGGSLISALITGYGVKLRNVVFTILLIILGAAAGYQRLGIPTAQNFPDAIMFSMQTFVLGGFIGGVPRELSLIAEGLFVIESFIGTIFTVLLGYILVTRDSP